MELKFRLIYYSTIRMEEIELPTIKDMYNCTRQNYDYNVIRAYAGAHKNLSINPKPTKKDHYLDQAIKLNSSPGPANTANRQLEWTKKNMFQCKRAEKATYLDQIYKKEKKFNFPSPSQYLVSSHWPQKKEQLKTISQKINFTDTCEYNSLKTPGPGNYNIRTHFSKGKLDKKWSANSPLKPRQVCAAQVGSYSPISQEFNTFAKYQLQKHSSQASISNNSQQKSTKLNKQNKFPGPTTYSTIVFWDGKQSPKKNEGNFFKHISKGPSPSVYHS